jgi:ATP-dependent RNA helicase DeaD
MVEDAFKGFSFQGRDVRVNVSENTGGFSGGGRGRERGDGERKSYGGGSGGGRKSFGEKKSYGGDRKSSFGGEKKSYGKSYGEKSRSYGDRPATKTFGGKSGKPEYSDRKPKSSASSDGGDWKALMGDTGGDRKKKFGKKKW